MFAQPYMNLDLDELKKYGEKYSVKEASTMKRNPLRAELARKFAKVDISTQRRDQFDKLWAQQWDQPPVHQQFKSQLPVFPYGVPAYVFNCAFAGEDVEILHPLQTLGVT